MLIYFSITNFRSIQRMHIDFTFAEGKAPNGYREMPYYPFLSDKSVRVVPCLALYGANASGKTNVIKALQTVQIIQRDGITKPVYQPNTIQECGGVTSFELSFNFRRRFFEYTVTYDRDRIVSEELCCDGLRIYSIDESSIDVTHLITSAFTQERLEKIFNVESCDADNRFVRTYLSVLAHNYAQLQVNVADAYSYISEKLIVQKSDREQPDARIVSTFIAEQSRQSINGSLQRIVEVLQRLDIDITRIECDAEEIYKLTKDRISGVENMSLPSLSKSLLEKMRSYRMNYANEEIMLPFSEESSGTKKLVLLVTLILHALESGGVLIIDELDCSLHPFLLVELIQFFKDKRHNTQNAQLIFTTHNTDVMDHELMRISEIGIINKTKKNGSTIVRISDFKGVRNVTRFRKQYLAGRFAGISFPYI